jgi:uncharacterized 2Fe-2S/4Fe-4S cluster protein (DUF4445 family)
MSWTVKVLSHGLTVSAENREILSDKLRAAGIPVSVYCNKRGLCGKCFVEVVSGELPPPLAKEAFWIKEKNLGEKFRLACQLEIASDLVINVPSAFIVQAVPLLPNIPRSAVIPDPAVRKYHLEIPRPEIASPLSLFDLIVEGLGAGHLKIPVDLLKALPRALETCEFGITVAVHREKEIIAVEPASSLYRNFGLAVDIGTTTLVIDLVDLDSGRTVDTEAALNGQFERGADVISRVTYAYQNPTRAAELKKLVLESLNAMIGKLLARSRLDPSEVYEIVVSGNTVMSHLVLGVPVDTLAAAPYHAVFSTGPTLEAREIGFAVEPHAKVYFSPNIQSFVGGDISSGLLASRLAEKAGHFLLIDLGTNGEIVLKTGDTLITTATAAGPAFEGMTISCGMPALPGAIYRAEDDGKVRTSVIGHQRAQGVCGTGLIDLVAIALARGEITARGAIRNAAKKIPVSGDFSLTQDDVRQLQLACAAVKTGMRMLLAGRGLAVGDLDGIYIAGAFGNYLNIPNSMALGLLPRIDQTKLVFIGNSSLAGARLLLVAKTERDRVESLVRGIRYVSLASDPKFQDHFIEALEFKPWP